MKVVLDTNAFISCIGKASPWRRVFDGFLREQYTLCLSAEVLLEYEEKFEEFWGDAVTANLLAASSRRQIRRCTAYSTNSGW